MTSDAVYTYDNIGILYSYSVVASLLRMTLSKGFRGFLSDIRISG